MIETMRRFARTEKGHGEIVEGRRNLRGKVRTLLFLIDPAKSAEQVEQQAEQIGATYEQLAQLITDGYVVELGTATPANDASAGVSEIDEVGAAAFAAYVAAAPDQAARALSSHVPVAATETWPL